MITGSLPPPSTNPFMPKKASFGKEEAMALVGRLRLVKATLEESMDHIVAFKKGINPFPGATLPEHNVIFIAPHIRADFDKIKDKAVPYSDLVGILEFWTMELTTALAGNRHHLLKPKSKMLLAHHKAILDVCSIANAVDLDLKENLKNMGV